MSEVFLRKPDLQAILHHRPPAWWQTIKRSVIRDDGDAIRFDTDHPAFQAATDRFGAVAAQQVTAKPSAHAAQTQSTHWGAIIWNEWHHRPIAAVDLTLEHEWIDTLANRIPCGDCRAEFLSLRARIPSFKSLAAAPDGRLRYARLIFDFHNKVNRKIGHPEFAWAEAVKIYGWDGLAYKPFVRPQTVDDLRTVFDSVWYINLDARKDRRERFEKSLVNFPFAAPRRFAAIDGGKTGFPADWKHGPGAWGCVQSHRAVAKQTMDRGDNLVLVLEDDATWEPNFAEQVLTFLQAVPDDFNLLFLGGQQLGEWKQVAPGIVRAFAPHRLHGYVMRGSAIRAAYECWTNADHHADHAIKDLFGRRHITYMPDPPLVAQSDFKSDIGSEAGRRVWQIARPIEGRRIESLGMTIVSARTGFGIAAVGGSLGYDASVTDGVLLPPALSGRETISAHADSEIVVDLERPIHIGGMLNPSAKRIEGKVVDFTIDWNLAGSAFAPAQTTRDVLVRPGRHTLRATVRRGIENHHRHSVWTFAPAHLPPVIPATAATPENTAVVAIAAYQPPDIVAQTSFLLRSASRQGVWLNLFGIGGGYNHFDKVVRLREWIAALPAHYTHVLYVDARDTVICRPLQSACDAYNAQASPVLIGAERSCWPENSDEWSRRFTTDHSAGRFLNAGCFMGDRASILNALAWSFNLSQKFIQPECAKGIEDLWKWRNWKWDDQHLWQCQFLARPEIVALDGGATLVANLTTQNMELGERNTYYDFATDGPILRETGGKPFLLHFSGGGAAYAMEQWAGWLDLI